MRADARRNEERILAATRALLVERGTGVPMEQVARRAGVGIGTVYRRFTDRRTLLRAVAVDALSRSRAIAENALAAAPTGFAALAAYLHATLDLRVSAVMPLLLDQVDLDDPDLAPVREASAGAVERLVAAAHADGLAADVTVSDVALLLVRLARPLPGPMPPAAELALAHRHVDLLLAGLAAYPGRTPAGGESWSDLGGLRAAALGPDVAGR
jgi:AcrR family transcriptional regulator